MPGSDRRGVVGRYRGSPRRPRYVAEGSAGPCTRAAQRLRARRRTGERFSRDRLRHRPSRSVPVRSGRGRVRGLGRGARASDRGQHRVQSRRAARQRPGGTARRRAQRRRSHRRPSPGNARRPRQHPAASRLHPHVAQLQRWAGKRRRDHRIHRNTIPRQWTLDGRGNPFPPRTHRGDRQRPASPHHWSSQTAHDRKRGTHCPQRLRRTPPRRRRSNIASTDPGRVASSDSPRSTLPSDPVAESTNSVPTTAKEGRS